MVASQLEIEADRGLLDRVLANLLGNALRYARTAIRISAAVDAERARIVVANDGPQVPAESRARIFVPFIQLDGAPAGGAGLGLAFCRMALQAHGGTIELGDGSAGEVAFEVTLPLRTAR
ncbi:MAG TPA: ATP-binding protein [Polyangia bacterium]|nr:ATP-binding protein [Polyangia bacterium]